MADDALRTLLAEFLVKIDPTGELAKGDAKIEALKASAAALEARLAAVAAAAAPAGRAVKQAFSGFGATPGLAAAIQGNAQNAAAGLFGQFGAVQGGDGAQFGPDRFAGPTRETLETHLAGSGSVLGPTRDTLTAHLAEQKRAADALANSFQGRLSAGFKSISASADTFKISGSGILKTLTSLHAGIAALAGGFAVRFVGGLVESIADIGDAAPRLGVTTDEFQRLSLLAEQSGTSIEALGPAFRVLGKNAVEPTKLSSEAFKLLNVSVKDAAGQFKSRQDLFFDTATALSGVTNETQRATLAQVLFGRGATELLPLLNEGKAGLDAQREALAKMGVVSEETVRKAKNFDDRWKAVKANLLAKIAPLLEQVVIPAFEKMVDIIVAISNSLEKFVKNTDFGSLALASLGTAALMLGPQLALLVALGGGWIRTLGGMALAAGRAVVSFARMALPFLLLEDVIGFFRGDDSEVGDLLSKIFGPDGGAAIQKAATDITEALKELWDWVTGKGAGTKLQELGQLFKDFAEVLGKDINEGNGPLTQSIRAAIGVGPGGLANPGGAPGGTDSRTQNVTVNVGSTSEVAGAVSGATNGLGRDAAANLAAVGG